MPAGLPSANLYRNLRLREAAVHDVVLTLRCNLCRRRTRYLAADLLPVLGPDHPLHVPPWPCSRCGTTEYLNVKWRVLAASQRTGLTVRRPVPRVTKWIWRDETL